MSFIEEIWTGEQNEVIWIFRCSRQQADSGMPIRSRPTYASGLENRYICSSIPLQNGGHRSVLRDGTHGRRNALCIGVAGVENVC